jgi:hypothetical protein
MRKPTGKSLDVPSNPGRRTAVVLRTEYHLDYKMPDAFRDQLGRLDAAAAVFKPQ